MEGGVRFSVPIEYQDAAADGQLHHLGDFENIEQIMQEDDSLLLRIAACFGHLEDVRFCLDHGANISDEGQAAINDAAKNGHLDVVQLCAERGADVRNTNYKPFQLASEKGHQHVVDWLRSIEASP